MNLVGASLEDFMIMTSSSVMACNCQFHGSSLNQILARLF